MGLADQMGQPPMGSSSLLAESQGTDGQWPRQYTSVPILHH